MSITKPVQGGLIEHEVVGIVNDKFMNPTSLKYSVVLHTADDHIFVDLLESVEILRDYVNNIADYTLVSFQLYIGDYVKRIVPFMNNLEMEVTMTWYDRTFTSKYKFVIVNNKGAVNGSQYNHMTLEELNKQGQVSVEGQCVDKVVEALRTLTVDGIYNYTTPAAVMRGVIKQSAKELSLGGDTLDIDINLIKPNNQKLYRHINLPTGINVFDVPSYIQNTEYGIYNTGIGTYFQPYGATTAEDNIPRDTMFIYPLHNPLLYEEAEKKLMIIVEPTGMYKHSEYTFSTDGDIVKIIVSGNIKNFDNGDNDMMNEGSGIISSNPLTAITGNKLVTDDEVKSLGEIHLSGEKFKDRKDGVTKPKYVSATANMYTHRSDIAARNLAMYQVEWRFCNPDLLYPGMPTAVTFVDVELGPLTLKGSLQSVYIKYSKLNASTSALLNIMVEKANTVREMEEDEEV
jgi:hypothetical protein